MNVRKSAHFGVFAASVICLIGCAQQVVAPDPFMAGDAPVADGAVIVGSVDWVETLTLAEGSAARANSRAVAYLSIPAAGSRCTAFLIAPDVIMTNEHCIGSAADAAGARAYFDYETGSTVSDAGYDCSTFLGNDAALDYALLQCAGRPGDTYGVLGLGATTMARTASVYVVHQNCDYYTAPSCAPTKKYSPGRVTSTASELGHDADTLGGSSGSPVFSQTTQQVVALHHVGLGNNGNGRGTENRAVPMTRILPVIQQRHPGLELGARAPAEPTEPTEPAQSDPYEPNDASSNALFVELPFVSADAEIVDGTDVDHFAFVSDGSARTIAMAFSHSAGDLDLYLYDAAGTEVGRSIGTTDEEAVTAGFSAGTTVIVRIVGYRGATGSYTITIE